MLAGFSPEWPRDDPSPANALALGPDQVEISEREPAHLLLRPWPDAAVHSDCSHRPEPRRRRAD